MSTIYYIYTKRQAQTTTVGYIGQAKDNNGDRMLQHLDAAYTNPQADTSGGKDIVLRFGASSLIWRMAPTFSVISEDTIKEFRKYWNCGGASDEDVAEILSIVVSRYRNDGYSAYNKLIGGQSEKFFRYQGNPENKVLTEEENKFKTALYDSGFGLIRWYPADSYQRLIYPVTYAAMRYIMDNAIGLYFKKNNNAIKMIIDFMFRTLPNDFAELIFEGINRDGTSKPLVVGKLSRKATAKFLASPEFEQFWSAIESSVKENSLVKQYIKEVKLDKAKKTRLDWNAMFTDVLELIAERLDVKAVKKDLQDKINQDKSGKFSFSEGFLAKELTESLLKNRAGKRKGKLKTFTVGHYFFYDIKFKENTALLPTWLPMAINDIDAFLADKKNVQTQLVKNRSYEIFDRYVREVKINWQVDDEDRELFSDTSFYLMNKISKKYPDEAYFNRHKVDFLHNMLSYWHKENGYVFRSSSFEGKDSNGNLTKKTSVKSWKGGKLISPYGYASQWLITHWRANTKERNTLIYY